MPRAHRLLVVRLLAVLAMSSAPALELIAQRPAPSHVVAITGVTVIDVASGRRLRGRTVLVRGDRIATVGTSSAVAVPRGARRVDGRGKFLIPGLWDAHVHVGTLQATTFPLLLAHGVTAVRDLHLGPGVDAAAAAVALRDSLEAGTIVGPRYLVGTQVAAPGHGAPTALHVATPEEGRAMVRRLHAARADIVKAYSGLTLETFRAILDEATRLGMPVDGHVSNHVGAVTASDAGQRTIEHVAESGVLFGCTTKGAGWGAEVRQARASGNVVRSQVVWGILRRAADAYDEPSCRTLARRLARNRTAFTPTLHVQRAVYALSEVAIPVAERGFLPPAQLLWYDSARVRAAVDPDNDAWRAYLRRERDITRVMQDEGVLVLAGTDLAPWGFPVPGASLHEELGLLADAGLTPLAALRAATINPARAFRMTDSLGTIARGKLADLVLLDADPLLDVGNARRITAVITRGRVLGRPALDSMRAEARARLAAER